MRVIKIWLKQKFETGSNQMLLQLFFIKKYLLVANNTNNDKNAKRKIILGNTIKLWTTKSSFDGIPSVPQFLL